MLCFLDIRSLSLTLSIAYLTVLSAGPSTFNITRSVGVFVSGCTFEVGLCLWTSIISPSSSQMTVWTRHSGETLSMSTGPDVDNTLGSSRGHYVYVEATSHAGHTAVLRGQDFSYDDNICSVAFCYHMYGSDAGVLQVNAVSSDGVTQKRWTQPGDQGNQWRCVEIRVFDWASHMKQHNFTIHVAFSATVGSSFRSDIALDDIRYYHCAGQCSIACTVVDMFQ